MNLNIRSNSLWVLLEVVCSSIFLFVIYRLIVHQLGIAALGVWSIVLATTSLVRVVDPGASTGLGRFIALAHGQNDKREMGNYFITGLTSTFVLYATLSIVSYWPLRESLRVAASGANLDEARVLLPYAMVSFLLMNFNSAIQGTLIGLQRSDRKSQIVICSLIAQLLLAFWLVPAHGLIGLAWAQIGQYGLAIVAGYFLSVRHIHGHFALRLPFHWSASAFTNLLSFGSKLQALTVVSFLYEPASKFVISSVAGVETLGLFEMAQKLVLQARQLLIGPTTVLMPAFALLHDQASTALAKLYRRSMAAATIIGAALMGAAALGSPIISLIWLDRIDGLFVVFVAVTSAAWLVNILAAPSYILAMGSGKLLWNFLGNVVTLVCCPLLALSVGKSVGPVGVVSLVVSAMAVGSLFTMIMNSRETGLPLWSSRADLFEFIHSDLARLSPWDLHAKKT